MKAVKSHSFNPFKYISKTNHNKTNDISTTSSNTDSNNESIQDLVAKGHKRIYQVDMGKFSKLCRKFRHKKDVEIKELRANDKEDFKLMVSYVHLLYDTEYYHRLFRKVKKYFGNMENIKPGTIGGYFGGCLVKSDMSNDKPGCSVACAGSIPPPKESKDWDFCDKAVILAERIARDKYYYHSKGGHKDYRDCSGYKFTILKEPEMDGDLDPCYLYVDSLDLHEFPGFSDQEMNKLDSLGCRKVILYGYDTDGLTYHQLYDHPIDIYEIKFRPKCQKKSSTWTYTGLALVLFLIFFLLLIMYYGYDYVEEFIDTYSN